MPKRAKTTDPLQLGYTSSAMKPLDLSVFMRELRACRPKEASGSYRFKWDYLESEILSKYTGPQVEGLSLDEREAAAYQKMFAAESVCKRINTDGLGLSQGLIHRASAIVRSVLGDLTPHVFENSGFSAGASTTRKKAHGDPWYKYHMTRELSVTPGCWKYAQALIAATPVWCAHGGAHNITRHLGNEVTTVPKNSKVERCIAKEPDLNMALQRSIGNHIRGRLKRVLGIDLNDQSTNQRLARIGSEFNSLATIDLSSASDSISQRLVFELVTEEWFTVLNDLRSHYGSLPNGEIIYWEKWSSMGNGYTFELESLLFAALSISAAEAAGYERLEAGVDFSVYGDDIIVPTKVAGYVIAALEGAGFTVNLEKTFVFGPFRESCGKHYHGGFDVTPFYIRKDVDSQSRFIWLLNRIRVWSQTDYGVLDPSTYSLWLDIRRKFLDPRLIGGRSLESVTSAVSIETPRDKLAFYSVSRRLDGWRALLRRWQGLPVNGTTLVWSTLPRRTADSGNFNAITTVFPSFYRLSANEDQWGEYGFYPQEWEQVSSF